MPGFRFSDQMKTEGTRIRIRIRLNVKNVNEILDNEGETERIVYTRSVSKEEEWSYMISQESHTLSTEGFGRPRIRAYLHSFLKNFPSLDQSRNSLTISLPCSQNSKSVPILIQTTPVNTVPSNLFKSYYRLIYELAFQNSLPWKIYGGFIMCVQILLSKMCLNLSFQ